MNIGDRRQFPNGKQWIQAIGVSFLIWKQCIQAIDVISEKGNQWLHAIEISFLIGNIAHKWSNNKSKGKLTVSEGFHPHTQESIIVWRLSAFPLPSRPPRGEGSGSQNWGMSFTKSPFSVQAGEARRRSRKAKLKDVLYKIAIFGPGREGRGGGPRKKQLRDVLNKTVIFVKVFFSN